jgi:hypothetical protein
MPKGESVYLAGMVAVARNSGAGATCEPSWTAPPAPNLRTDASMMPWSTVHYMITIYGRGRGRQQSTT